MGFASQDLAPLQVQSKFKVPVAKQEPLQPVSEMTSLANLPPPKANVIVSSFDDDGWGDADWDFEDVKEEKVIDIKAPEYQN